MKTCWSGWRTGGVSAKTTDVSHDFGYPLRPGNLQRPSRLANFDTHAHPQGDKDALSLWKRPARTRGPRSNTSIAHPLSDLHRIESGPPCILCDTVGTLGRAEQLGGIRTCSTATVWKPADRLIGIVRHPGTEGCSFTSAIDMRARPGNTWTFQSWVWNRGIRPFDDVHHNLGQSLGRTQCRPGTDHLEGRFLVFILGER
jgi:hypothetical protein